MVKIGCLMQIRDVEGKANRGKKATEVKKWFDRQIFKGLDKVDGGEIAYINGKIDQLLSLHKKAKKSFKLISKKLCDDFQKDQCRMSFVLLATQEYCQYLIQKIQKVTTLSVVKRSSKIEKVYTICNHALKIDYKNAVTWKILGDLYSFM